MQSRLSYARAWYGCRNQKGAWCFAPAKFAGYQDIDAQCFLDEAEAADGRRTEAQLNMFFSAINPATPLHAEANAALFAFLARYGKIPSMKARINVMRNDPNLPAGASSPVEAQDAVVALMLAVSKTLPPAQLQSLVAELTKNPCSPTPGVGPIELTA
ncbi:putative paraquat-inducible protein A [Rhodoblastus acidophilus]|uniref:hypothetical protein n=1 Tax=Rhodoblastus acidophilus TaxID=1074 RepID=UPI0022251A63|nr:hypothetical protein [Rhodoblastus acidophilus]MCW2284016.1 putative paraquat-inducible protein A [Rhodoblastus acidophilus]MCW2332712.1 putative paraquat-inducible protein A [Rhodoblastus acidophilus]